MTDYVNPLEILQARFGMGRPESKTNNKRYLFTCPKCGQEKLKAFFLSEQGQVVCDGDNGLCGYKTNAYLVRKELVAQSYFPVIKKAAPVSREINWPLIHSVYNAISFQAEVNPGDKQWLLSRGLSPRGEDGRLLAFSSRGLMPWCWKNFSPETLKECGLCWWDPEQERYRGAGVLGPDRIVIPYYLPEDPAKITYLRSRSLLPCARALRYLAPRELPQSQMIWTLPGEADTILVTEGEFKAMALSQYGLKALALPGMTCSHARAAQYIKEKGYRQVVLCFDTEANQGNVDQQAQKLKQRLLNLGITRVRNLRLPLLGQEKMDADTFLLRTGKEGAQKIQEFIERNQDDQ